MEIKGKRVIVLDVCGTLVNDNTTVGLIGYHLSKHDKYFRLATLKTFSHRISPVLWLAILAEKIFNRHFVKYVIIYLLRGEKEEELQISANEYAEFLWKFKQVAPVQHLLLTLPEFNDIVLASASLSPIVSSLAKFLDTTKFVSSELSSCNGILDGKYLKDLTGVKDRALVEKFGDEFFFHPFCIVSDNISDKSLFVKSSKSFAVLNKKSHKGKWKGVKTSFVINY
jgi:phosphoserine phosphatase